MNARLLASFVVPGLLSLPTAARSAEALQEERPVARRAVEAPVRTGRIVQRELPPLIHAPLGAESPVRTPSGDVLGTFEDHVIDLATGAVTFVVVRTDDASRLVPYARFRWDAEVSELFLSAPTGRARGAAGVRPRGAADARPLRPRGRRRRGAPARGVHATRGSGPAAERDGARRDRLGAPDRGREAATTSALLLEPTIGRVRFALATARDLTEAEGFEGGAGAKDPLVLPWRALRFRAARPATDEAPAEAAHFELGACRRPPVPPPRLEGGDPAKLGARELRDTIRSFYRAVVPVRGGATVRAKGARGERRFVTSSPP